MQDQLHSLLKKLVIKNNIHLHQEELKLQLLSHPSYPSLHSITGVLDHFGIPNLAIRLPQTSETLSQLPKTFIGSMSSDNGEEIVLVEKRKTTLKIIDANGDIKSSSIAEFLESWSGVIVAIEKDETVVESESKSGKGIRSFLLAFTAVALTVYLLYSNTSVFAISHIILSIVGVALSAFIVRQELGLNSEKINSFCNLSENTSCDTILNSKGARFGIFKLSDVSIVVFSGFILSWLLFSLNSYIDYTIFKVLAIFAMPFLAYSVYYQYKIAKVWCPLCLGIIAVLFLQFGALFLDNNQLSSLTLHLNSVLLFTFGTITSIVVWASLKPLLKQNNDLKKLEVDHYKFKRNFMLFNSVYQGEQGLINVDKINGEIILGNENAPIELIMVTSPFCFYCKDAHKDIERILFASKNKVKVSIRFRVGSENKDSDFYKIASHILHVYHSQGQMACSQLLSKLYDENANLKKWLEETNIHFNPAYDTILGVQKNWCDINAINFTPAFYLNGRSYPNEYNRTDLIFFIDEIIEELETQNTTTALCESVAS